MATPLNMPQMGYDMHEGTLVRWLKSEDDEVSLGEPIAEIETDKAVVEVEATAAGLLRKILAAEGTTVPVGQPIAIIGEAERTSKAWASTIRPRTTPRPPPKSPPASRCPRPSSSLSSSQRRRRRSRSTRCGRRRSRGVSPRSAASTCPS